MSRITKRQSCVAFMALIGWLSGVAAPAARAQTTKEAAPQIAHADFSGALGWFHGNESDVAARYNTWYNRSLFGGASFGYYWTDHWKTEFEVSGNTQADVYGERRIDIPEERITSFAFTRHSFSNKTVSIGQSYQFFRNAWFHPFLGAGVDLDWEHHRFETPRQTVFQGTPPVFREVVITPGESGEETAFEPKGYATAGFKSYFNERAFFRTDIKFAGAGRLEHVIWRIGVGVDWGK